MQSKALLRDVLRSQGLDHLTSRLQRSPLTRGRDLAENDDSEDELVSVQSLPGTPARSRTTSRASSPTRASSRRLPGPLHLSTTTTIKNRSGDPLRAFPTDISQLIFRLLSIEDLAICACVCRKWAKSQTLNYGNVWHSNRVLLPLIWNLQFGSNMSAKIHLAIIRYHLVNGRGESPS